MLLFPVLTVSVALSIYTTSGYLLIPLPGIDIMDIIVNLILIPFISKIDTASIFYLNAFIILLPLTPPVRSFAVIIAGFVIISAFTIKIKSIYYPLPD